MTFLSTDEDALDWAREYIRFERQALVQARPWGRTFRLQIGGSFVYLKVCTAERPIEPTLVPLLDSFFPGQVPRVRAHDRRRGTLLTDDFDAIAVQSTATVEDIVELARSYARLQGEARHIPQLLETLPVIPPSRFVDELFSFLDPESPVGARYWVSQSEVKKLRDAAISRLEMIDRIVNNANGLVSTINHCDLHLSNVAKTRAGALIIFDWSDAIAGPAGMSLSGMFGGCRAVLASLLALTQCSDPDHDDIVGRGLVAYVETLVRVGYASRTELFSALLTAAFMGLVRNTVDLPLFRTSEPDVFGWTEHLVRRSVDEILLTLDLYERVWERI